MAPGRPVIQIIKGVTMRDFFIVIIVSLFLISCSAKSAAPDKSGKDSRNQRSVEQMDKAIDELNSGSTSQPGNVYGDGYGRQLNEADKAHKELECAVGDAECFAGKQKPSAPPAPAVQEKSRPVTTSDTPVLQEKSRPTAVRDGASPARGTKYPIVSGYPIWFQQPGYDGYLGGVGVAPKQKNGDRAAQRRAATTLAQADLVRSVKVNVSNELKSEKLLVDTRTQKYYKEKFDSMSRQQADEYINNPQVMDEWADEKTGEIYIWVVLPK